MADSQIGYHTTEAAPLDDDESLSDDEFFDCLQPEDGPARMEPVPSSVKHASPPTTAGLGSGGVASPEPRSLTPKPVETLPQVCGMYRLLNLVTERGTGGISK